MTAVRRVAVLGTIPDRSEAALLAALAGRGIRVLGVFEPRAGFVDSLRNAGVDIGFMTLDRRRLRQEAAELAALLAKFDPDLVHVLRSKSLRLLRAAYSEGLPRTVFYRGTIERPKWWNPAHRRKYLDPRIHRLIAVSEAVRHALISGGVEPRRIAVIRKGHDPAWYEAAAIDLRSELGVAPATHLLGVIANIRWEKGVEYAVTAAHLLATRGRAVHLVLVGNDERNWLAQRLRPLADGGRVTHLGHRKDVASLLPALDTLVIPSLREGSPRVAAEAMLRGVPVVASAVGGLPEIVADGKTGLLVPPRNAAAIADAVERLIDEPGLARTLTTAARNFFLEHVTVERAAEQTLRLYEEVVNEA